MVTVKESIARIDQRLDDAIGYITEERHHNKAYGYFGGVVRRIRQLKGPGLDDILEPPEGAGSTRGS